jgi:hypothetical protein
VSLARRFRTAGLALAAVVVGGAMLTAGADPSVPLVPAEVTLFAPSTVPARTTIDESASVELGVRFSADVPGEVTGVRFYKGAGNVGTHVGSLWASTGVRLATVTFVGETAGGWQTAYFPARLSLAPGATYTVSYLAPNGHFPATPGTFPLDNAPLHAPAGNNGVYHYGPGDIFPTSTYLDTDYGVDVVFKPAPAGSSTTTTAPATTSTTEAPTTTVATTTTLAPTTTTTAAPTTTTSTTAPPTTTTTTAPPAGGDPCASFPAQPANKPSASTTGVPAGTSLAVTNGDVTVTTAGAVVDARDIRGTLFVNANNVTVRNSRIHPASGENSFGIRIGDGKTGTKVLHSEIGTDSGGYVGILGDSVVACADNIFGFGNGLTIGGGTTIQANWIHNLAQPGSDPHIDGVELYDGANVTAIGNVIVVPTGGGGVNAWNLTAFYGNVSHVVISGNWLDGGTYTLGVRQAQGHTYSDVKVLGNRFGRHFLYGPDDVSPGPITESGNVWDDTGAALEL